MFPTSRLKTRLSFLPPTFAGASGGASVNLGGASSWTARPLDTSRATPSPTPSSQQQHQGSGTPGPQQIGLPRHMEGGGGTPSATPVGTVRPIPRPRVTIQSVYVHVQFCCIAQICRGFCIVTVSVDSCEHTEIGCESTKSASKVVVSIIRIGYFKAMCGECRAQFFYFTFKISIVHFE